LSRPKCSAISADTAARRRRIVAAFQQFIAARLDENVRISEACKAIAVSERTLRMACAEQLGVSPKQYQLLRRMQHAQRVLQAADPTRMTVTEVAMHFGHYHLGRFAARYRQQFGEPPSTTRWRHPSAGSTR
jgi:AraC-like DNA-binding protein